MAASFWPQFSRRVLHWLDKRGLAARDAVLLLPFAQHLAPARRAWMQLGRWQPRIETTHSLASALGPKLLPQPLQISFDAAIDALSARSLLQGQSWAQMLKRSDARAYDLSVQRLVEAAHAWARAAAQRPPALREAFWQEARAALQAAGPGALERALAMVALEWAATDSRAPATDALFDLRPSAWVLLQCGGPEPLANAVLNHAEQQEVPVLRLSADLPLEEAFASSPPPGIVEQAVFEDFESLAQCSAAAVLQHLQQGRQPVALIAQDRVLIRRVRALLERQSVTVGDETGWMLATLPQATQMMAVLRAARAQASLDDWLGCMKSELAIDLTERYGAAALSSLELQCRKRGWSSPLSLQPEQLSPGSARLWMATQAALQPLHDGPVARALADWLTALGDTLQRLGASARLDADPAGAQVLDALWLRRSPWPGSAHEAVLQQARLSFGEFVAWVEATLEAAQFVPASTGPVSVLITPMARAMLRPFGAAVLPGADALTLGPVPAGPALLSDALVAQLGMPTLTQRREAQALTFAQLLRVPALTLMRCHSRGQGPLAPSPLLERLEQALLAAGLPPPAPWQDGRSTETVQARGQRRAQASTPGLLPAQLSASALDALRHCPYQFFARVQLGLREQAELEAPVDKRDYGTWLHAVLHQFHEERLPADVAGGDAKCLRAVARQQMQSMGLSEAEFLPFSASFERFIPAYLDWLREHEAAGGQYLAGELDREIRPFAPLGQPLQDLLLRGRIDRVDRAGTAQLLIDYKTGSAAGLKDKVAVPMEDTQLAVYALLMGAEAEGGEQQALYLALDESKGVEAVVHPEVGQSAALLVDGLADDLLAIYAGEPLPALGEGAGCEYCEMRGLCRRDDWMEGAP